jgi:hypothetical protein
MSEVLNRQAAARAKREARDSALDTLIPPMDFADTKDCEKGPIFTRGALKLLAGAVVVVGSIALAFALA